MGHYNWSRGSLISFRYVEVI